MAKKRLLIDGNIQDVGYRVFVKFNARKLGIRGLVRNLPEDTVEVFCDKDEDTLDNFIKAIDVKAHNGQTDTAHVDSIEVYEETDPRYSEGKAPLKFEKFDIDYGEGLLPSERENLHRQEILVFHGSSLRAETRTGLKDLGEKVDGVGQDVKDMHKDMNQSFDGLGSKVDGVGENVHAMHTDMIVLFDALDGKYHTIGDSIINTNRNIERMNENNARVNDNNTRLIENNAQMTDNLKTLTDALKSIVDDYIAEKRKETGKAR